MKQVILASCFLFVGCSVYMAADRGGTDITTVQRCSSRIDFLNLGAKLVSSERQDNGTTHEIYLIPKEKGSALRAVMHGLLDLSTGFGWEFIGTPLELYMVHNSNFTLKVVYDSNDKLMRADFI